MALIQRHLCTSHSQATPGGVHDDLNRKSLQSAIEGTSKGRLAKLSTVSGEHETTWKITSFKEELSSELELLMIERAKDTSRRKRRWL